jgi:hypothetical protein
MMSRSRFLAASVYVGALLVGAAVGVAVDRKVVRDPMIERSMDPRAQRERFFADLGLSDSQRVAWDSIAIRARRADSVLMAPFRAQQDSVFAPLRPKLDSLRAQRNALVKARDQEYRAVLTPEQLKVFDERQARRQKQSSDRR